jgi:ribose 1,5-bisphosphokinase
MAEGALALVVGPSGAGKDTLIAAARAALAGDPRFSFPRRTVTRAAVASLEDHDTLDPAEFDRQKLRGAYALDWQAHGLSYGIPAAIDAEIAGGRVVVVNTSRKVLGRAVEKYRNCHVLLVTAEPDVRAVRLAGRGRESEAEIAARLAREGIPVPGGIAPTVIDNSGSLGAGVAAFVAAIRAIAR